MNDHNHLKSLINNNDGIFPVKKTNDTYILKKKIYIYLFYKKCVKVFWSNIKMVTQHSVKCGKQTDQNYV